MAYDAQLAARVRVMFAAGPPVLEKAMFGGLAFLVDGRIAVAASSSGGLLVRVGAARAEQLVATTVAEPMQMGGRTMRGWVHVDGEHVRSRRELGKWIDIGIAAAVG
ncbi:TfoX/Sxy family protein [[Mycobacterium] nativiensis]|uniref:TfoX/Sxy family protein n=1 Tax=[Mycobacterium] nativiensis TaxID=2855503 RepID=A0ABU5Y2F5_9MYCO|nr:TfoX/Sxy family protein [Mycolicibacter sp. MYC340]MEB3034267.1 TfoX/Sxy family protein [Mycolicibacter sp. MYC340]